MQRLQRQAGKYMKRSADEADVTIILQEFHVADELLDHFMDSVRSFQNAWNDILAKQSGIAQHFEILYQPIHDPESKFNAGSDPALLDKATQLKSSYSDLERDLQQETNWIQTRLLQPAMDAKQSYAPIKKLLKKRENFKLDYERYLSRVDHAKAKGPKTARDETAMIKHESDLSQATVLYHGADDLIRKCVPAIVDAIQALVPVLLQIQIMLQHALVGQLYTVLNDFCQQFQFPTPAPAMEEVIAAWDREFSPLRDEVESGLKLLSTGKAIYQPMSPPDKPNTVSSLSIRNRFGGQKNAGQAAGAAPPIQRRSSSDAVEDAEDDVAPPRPPRPGQGSASSGVRPRIASSMSLQSQQLVPEDEEAPPAKPPRPSGPGPIPLSSKPRTPSSASISRLQSSTPSIGTPLPGMTPTLEAPNGSRRSSASTVYATPTESPSRPDYFGQNRTTSSASIASSIASKKKPPPPPVKRRVTNTELIVTALYDFAGQGEGDLSFREGDQIKVLKKSESTDDWWLGSVRGVSGSFPANYVQLP